MQTSSVDPHRLEDLLNYCVDFAKQMLSGHGAFHPFGAVIKTDGKLTAVGGYNGEEHPKGSEIYLLLQQGFKADYKQKKIIAAAIAADVNIPDQFEATFRDGIRVLLESSGYSRFIYLPYKAARPSLLGRLARQGYQCEYGELFAVEVPQEIMNEETGEQARPDNAG